MKPTPKPKSPKVLAQKLVAVHASIGSRYPVEVGTLLLESAAELKHLHAVVRSFMAVAPAIISECKHRCADGWMEGDIHGDDYDKLVAAVNLAEKT